MEKVNPTYTFLIIMLLFAGIGWYLSADIIATSPNIAHTPLTNEGVVSNGKDIRQSSVSIIPTKAYIKDDKIHAGQIVSVNTDLSLSERLNITDKFIANFKDKNEDPFEAIYLNYILINELNLADLQQLYFDSKIAFNETKSDSQVNSDNADTSKARIELLSLLQYFTAAKMGEIDSATAADFITEHPLNSQKVSAYTSIFNIWSSVALDDMHAWLNAQKNKLSDDALGTAYFILLREYAAKDFNFALSYLANDAALLTPTILASAVSGVLSRASQSIHFIELIEFTQALFSKSSLAKNTKALDEPKDDLAKPYEKPLEDSLSNKVFYQWSIALPQDLASWLAKHTNINEMPSIKKHVYGQYARHDLVDATIWYRANTPAGNKGKHYDPVQWGYADTINTDQFQKILDWIYTEDARYLVRIYRSVLKEAAVRAPRVAIRHIALITDMQKKRQATLDVYKGLIEAANPQADVFLNTSEFAGDKGFVKSAEYSKRNAMSRY
jgi:hypothetical protein